MLGPLLERPLAVVDAGARWGVAATWQWFGSHVRVFGFEPDLVEAAKLDEHYAGDPSIDIVPIALGREQGRVSLFVTMDPSGSSIFRPAVMPRFGMVVGESISGVVDVEVTSLDAWLGETGHGPVDAIKLDVQGAELQIFQGAVKALADVRMILAEVHLNEMYDDAPLFGEIDAFLRAHGFELWRLPVIAHYPTGIMCRHMIDRVDVHWHGTWPTAVPSPSGQAIWADALYVRRDFVTRAVASDMVRLVRDAAVAIGMDEPDLAASALTLALEVASPEWRPQLVRALRALGHRSPTQEFASSRWSHLIATAHDLAERIEVDLALPIVGWGWHDPYPGADDRYHRWTGPQREAVIDLAARLPAGTEICIDVVGAACAELLQTLAIEVDGSDLAVVATSSEAGLRYRCVTGAGWNRGFTRITLRTGRTVPWNELHPDSDDWTEYGIAVSGISLTPPGDRSHA
jgi:FkbM family methyltransferase